jgi:hypothetical protein
VGEDDDSETSLLNYRSSVRDNDGDADDLL